LVYLILFLEGILTFISPCLLPMIPLYISYLAGSGRSGDRSSIVNAIGFVIGFTSVFVSLGAFMGTVGTFLLSYSRIVDVICGIIMLVLGLNFTGIIRIPVLNSGKGADYYSKKRGFFPSVLFGMVFSVSWTPCVGTFLGSALMMAASSGGALKGTFMLLVYSFGLGIPFLLSALLIDQVKGTFDFIKKHYKAVTVISGALLIIVGVLMISGLFGSLLRYLSI